MYVDESWCKYIKVDESGPQLDESRLKWMKVYDSGWKGMKKTDWLNLWLINWLTDWLTDRLKDCNGLDSLFCLSKP